MGTWLEDQEDAFNNPSAPTTPARAIGTSFQPSLTKWVLCTYVIQQSQTTGQDGTVTLNSDAVDPPTTARGSARVNNANAATHVNRQQLIYLCPPAHFVKLVSSGTGTPTIVEQVETVIS